MSNTKLISNNSSDSILVSEYKAIGDTNTLAKLYEQYMDLIYGVCLKYLKNPDDAKDSVIEIFEELISKVKKYEIEHFRAWLYQLAKNHCLMKLRKEKSSPTITDLGDMQIEEKQHLEDVMDKENNLNAMHECIEQLSDFQKESVKLFYLQNKCYKEIAEITGVDSNKVRSNIQNGRRNLKICIDEKILEKQ